MRMPFDSYSAESTLHHTQKNALVVRQHHFYHLFSFDLFAKMLTQICGRLKTTFSVCGQGIHEYKSFTLSCTHTHPWIFFFFICFHSIFHCVFIFWSWNLVDSIVYVNVTMVCMVCLACDTYSLLET